MRGYSDNYIIREAEKALKTVGLLDYADEYPNIFGNPGLQKLGIARAIATGAKILIMDEPLGSLDPKVSSVFRHELRNLIKDLGLTAIHVTHNQEEAMSIADKIIIMRSGKILQMGTPYELYENPNSIFVANFLGETNFLQGFVLKLLENDQMNIWIRLGGPKIICNNFNNRFNPSLKRIKKIFNLFEKFKFQYNMDLMTFIYRKNVDEDLKILKKDLEIAITILKPNRITIFPNSFPTSGRIEDTSVLTFLSMPIIGDAAVT